jgi:hypothetical protein
MLWANAHASANIVLCCERITISILAATRSPDKSVALLSRGLACPQQQDDLNYGKMIALQLLKFVASCAEKWFG